MLVAVALLALIGSAALVLLAGSAEWQRNQLQTLADSTALDSALKIGTGCNAAAASTVITEADTFLATQRTRTGSLAIAAGTCATPYHGTDTFASGLSADYYYPYHAHQQQVEVMLTLNLPIAFGTDVGKTTTSVGRYAVAEALPAGVAAVSATTINCTGGQVNVAGDIRSQNAVNLSGACALYAHQRLSAGAYSSLGNASVYADGQAWLNAGGTCVAGANTGSSNAICSDGYELSGHVTPACGPGTTSYLSAANLAVNASPCAAGVGPQPVAPASALLPPEPNTDANAIGTLQGTGGAACTAGGVYPNIVVNGITVGTGDAPAPVKDASGFYHFKPSCYGYLNVGFLGGGISNVQVGPVSPVTTKTVTPTLGAASQVGTLLVADLRSDTNPSDKPFAAPAGWVFANGGDQNGASHSEIWYYPNNPGGITSVNFGVTPGSVNAIAQLSEWRNVAAASPLDQSGNTPVATSQSSATVSTSAATTAANDLVITDVGPAVQAGQVYTPGAGWTSMFNDMASGFAGEYRLDLPAGVASERVTTTKATTWDLAIAAFKPVSAGAGVVFDPGFYYFNGSGFAGGGGLCLNGGTLLGRDVTMEFVNTAGFSSGTCAAGGGANCIGACQFGSTPCSLSPCPPSSGADSPNNLTWLSAPCSTAPAAADVAACPGSAWCPAGDRSCWNELVWAPAANTGQIAIKGTVASAWLLGTLDWPGACTYQVNGSSTIAGTISCGTLTISAAAGATIAVGGDAGINTAQVEARLVE